MSAAVSRVPATMRYQWFCRPCARTIRQVPGRPGQVVSNPYGATFDFEGDARSAAAQHNRTYHGRPLPVVGGDR